MSNSFQEATLEQLRAAMELAAYDELHFSFYNEETNTYTKEPHPFIIVSDTFASGCADGENVAWEEVPGLLKAYKREGWPALVRWVARKRNMNPLRHMQARMFREDLKIRIVYES